MRRPLRADVHLASFVVGNLDLGAQQIMVDDVSRGIELEVQLQHQLAVASDDAFLYVCRGLVVDVLAVFLSRLIFVGNRNFRVRGGRAGFILLVCRIRIRAVLVLIVELDGVLGIGVRFPDSVEVVAAFGGKARRNASLEVNGGAAFGGRPAIEFITYAGGEIGRIARHGDQAVHERVLVRRLRSVGGEVGMVGHADRAGYGSVVRVQGHVRVHDDVHARIVLGSGAVLIRRPVGEDFVALLRVGVRNAGLRVLTVLVRVRRRRTGAAVQVVGHRIDDTLENGNDGRALIQRLIYVDLAHAVALIIELDPSDQNEVVPRNEVQSILIKLRAGNGGTGGNRRVLRESFFDFHVNYDIDSDRRLYPVGVQTQLVVRHGRALEDEPRGGFRDLVYVNDVPAHKRRVLAEACRTLRGRAFVIQRRAVLERLRGYSAIVVLFQNVLIAAVVEEDVALGRISPPIFLQYFGVTYAICGQTGNTLLIPVATAAVCILRISGASIIIHPVELLSFITVFRAGLIKALEHVIQMIQTICAIVCCSSLAIRRAKVIRHRDALRYQRGS